jgi:hypothetical protein
MNKSLRYRMLTATSAAWLALAPSMALAAGHPNAPTVGQEANQLNSIGSTEAGTTSMNSEQLAKTNNEASDQAKNQTKPFENSTMVGEATNKLTGEVVKGHGNSVTTEPSGAHPSQQGTSETSKSGKNDIMVGQASMNSEQLAKTNNEASDQAKNQTEPFKNSTMMGQATNEFTGKVVKGNGSSITTEPSGAHPNRQATNETSKNDTMVGQATDELNGRVIKGNGSITTESSGAHPTQ